MTINFHKNIYPLKAIKDTVQAYDGFAVFKITDKGEYYVLMLSNIKKGVEDTIKDEFCNYVLSRIKP